MADARPVIAATAVEAPWGPVHLAASERGILAIELMTSADAFADGLARRMGGMVHWVGPHTDARDDTDVRVDTGAAAATIPPAVRRQLQAGIRALAAALAGDDVALHALDIDLADRPPWDRAVLGAVRSIPRGETRSYGEIARQIGKPGAARAVGGAVGRNPVALAIPCHRVIAGDGTLGGYGGGWWGDRQRLLDLKSELLAGEGRAVRRRPSGRVAGR